MAAFLSNFSPVVQALFATLFTWFVTALGAATVFLNKSVSRKLLVTMLGFAAGVMIAASFFSLLLPLYVWVALRVRRFAVPVAVLTVFLMFAGRASGNSALAYLPVFLLGTFSMIAALHPAALRRVPKTPLQRRAAIEAARSATP